MQRSQNLSQGGQGFQGALQLLLARVHSSISNTVSATNFSRKINDLDQMIHRGPALTVGDFPAFVDALKNLQHGAINDREFLLEKVIVLMSHLADDSAFAKTAEPYVIDLLYKDLPHPPSGFLSTYQVSPPTAGEEPKIVSYAFRSADGSNNNVLHPSLGRAGQPYARSVPSTRIQTPSSLPDAGVVFDTLLRRKSGDFVPHPGGLSSLFFAFADLIIHSIFHTNSTDWTINDASSYLDLSIVYGSSPKQVDSMRRKDGTGKIWNDAFADSRLLFMPPSVCALAVLFSRHHNYIAENILNFNEHGSYSLSQSDQTSLHAQDNEIFHRARLVNTAFFMQVILQDYVGSILGLVRDGLTWRLDPLAPSRELDHAVSPRGEGNAVSLEFNLLYRWHASLSEHDEKWLDGLFRELLPNKDPETISLKDFGEVIRKKVTLHGDVQTWTFDGLTRGSDGRFADQDIARILQDATEHRAGAFRARGCPAVMRVIEILAIEQARKWEACTLNEFRKFIGLRPYKTFREWNPDPEISSAAERLYGHVDNLELHVGLQAEETKPPISGAGLCPGFTISRAILADAVCLTRGDRFLTVDYTPYNLTAWGYQHCQVNTADGSYGGMLSKLLLCLLPDQYPADSVYAHFPFMTPDFMRTPVQSHSPDLFIYCDWSRPGEFEVADVTGQDNAIYRARIAKLMKGVRIDFMKVRTSIVEQTLSVSFAELTKDLVKKASISAGANTMVIDVVKDVINRIPIYWAANFIVGLPITTLDGVWGGHTAARWRELFADVTKYLYFNNDPLRDWSMYQAAIEATDDIVHHLSNRLKRQQDWIISIGGASDMIATSVLTSNVQNDKFIAKVLSSTKSPDTRALAHSIFAESVPSALLFSAVISSVVDYYADPDQKEELQKLVQLSNDTHTQDMMKFVNNALSRSATSHSNGQASNGHSPSFVISGDHQIDIQGQRGLMSPELFSKVAPQVIKTIFSLKNIRFPQARMEFDGELPSSRVIQYDA